MILNTNEIRIGNNIICGFISLYKHRLKIHKNSSRNESTIYLFNTNMYAENHLTYSSKHNNIMSH